MAISFELFSPSERPISGPFDVQDVQTSIKVTTMKQAPWMYIRAQRNGVLVPQISDYFRGDDDSGEFDQQFTIKPANQGVHELTSKYNETDSDRQRYSIGHLSEIEDLHGWYIHATTKIRNWTITPECWYIYLDIVGSIEMFIQAPGLTRFIPIRYIKGQDSEE